ncbi:MAG: hypothetical protein ACLT8E_02475 [Akkermansia sp.]
MPVSGVEHAEYYYSTYSGAKDEVPVNDKKKIMILGGGPNRIGQGIGSTTPACTPPSPCGTTGMNPSW